jgi:hypothetical protein
MGMLFPLVLMLGVLSGCTTVTEITQPTALATVEVDAGIQIYSLAPPAGSA